MRFQFIRQARSERLLLEHHIDKAWIIYFFLTYTEPKLTHIGHMIDEIITNT